jgi:outer membrane protein
MSGTGAASSDSLGRKVALDVQHLMMGTPKPEALQLSNTTRIAINLTTAKQLGISFSEEVLENAETFGVNSEAKSALLDPSQVVQEAVASNLSLLSSRAGTLATQEDTNIARSALFPKVDMYLGYEAFDSNLQNASGGFLPNHVTSGTLNFKQPLLSDSSWSNLDVKAHQAKSSRFETITSELDIVNSALRDYVQVLLDHKNVLQEKEDIERTRSNLEVAQAKQSAGSSNLADVYRWESELAQAQSSLLELQATEQNSKTALNQILHRPLGDPFDLRDLDFNNQNFWVANPVFRNQLERADDFLILSQAIVKESISNSPEIKSLNEQVDASQSTLSSSKRKFFVPDLYFNFALSTALVPSDAGVYSPLTAQGPGLPVAFPGETNPQWSATFNLSFNIFNGLGDMAQIRKSSENVHQLELTRNSKQEQVEQSIRKALETTRANYLEIALRQKAAKASNSNYELVRQAYVRGGKSITDLIDAKNSAFTANLNSATATDSFFLSYFSMERALGRFDLLQSDQE